MNSRKQIGHVARARLWLRIVRWYLIVRVRTGREPLPKLAARIANPGKRVAASLLSRA